MPLPSRAGRTRGRDGGNLGHPYIFLAPSYPVFSFFYSFFRINLSIWSIIGTFVTLLPPPLPRNLIIGTLVTLDLPQDFVLDPSLPSRTPIARVVNYAIYPLLTCGFIIGKGSNVWSIGVAWST